MTDPPIDWPFLAWLGGICIIVVLLAWRLAMVCGWA